MLTLVEIMLISCLFRYLISLWDYSGYHNPPMYGDFEAQRHWMEITVNLPIGSWYRHELPRNDLNYWGLDYPPLTAYISYLFGRIALYIYPDLVTLLDSHGHESVKGKLCMRTSVILCDLLIFIPSILLLLNAMCLKPTTMMTAKNRWFLSETKVSVIESTNHGENNKENKIHKDDDDDDDDNCVMNEMITPISSATPSATTTATAPPSLSSQATSSSSSSASTSTSTTTTTSKPPLSTTPIKPRVKTINFRGNLFQLLCLCGPCLLLIDHGHFQYNGVCIGLTLLAIYFISYFDTSSNHNSHNYIKNDNSKSNNSYISYFHIGDVLGSIFFTLALNFKQMTLYYAPVFFCHLLHKSLLRSNIDNNNHSNGCSENQDSAGGDNISSNNTKKTEYKSSSITETTILYSKLYHFALIGFSVIVTFLFLWLPFCIFPHLPSSTSSSSSSVSSALLTSDTTTATTTMNSNSCIGTCLSSLQLIIKRIFPFSRGIFEDKVANIWYTLSVLFDYRTFYLNNPHGQIGLVKYSFVLTLFMISPVYYDLLMFDKKRRYKSLVRKIITSPSIKENIEHVATVSNDTDNHNNTNTNTNNDTNTNKNANTNVNDENEVANDNNSTASMATVAMSTLSIPHLTTTATSTATADTETTTTTRTTVAIHPSATVTATRLLFSLMTCSLAFFLASFQVHEKSLLLSAVPSLLLLPLDPLLFTWYQCLTAFTLFPLLIRDGLRIPYFAVIIAFLVGSYCVFSSNGGDASDDGAVANGDDDESNSKNVTFILMRKKMVVVVQQLKKLFIIVSFSGMIILHMLEIILSPPPTRYPDLHAALFSLYGAVNLVVLYTYLILWQVGFLCKNDDHNDEINYNNYNNNDDDEGAMNGDSNNNNSSICSRDDTMHSKEALKKNIGSTLNDIGSSMFNKRNKLKDQ